MRRREFLGCAAGAGLAGSAGQAANEPPPACLPAELADLDRGVQAALGSKRLGTPVFVRLTTFGPGKAVEQLAQLAALASRWLGQVPRRLHTVGAKGGPAAVTLLYAGGASALLSAVGGKTAGAIDLMVLGSRGALYHEGPSSLPAIKDIPDPILIDAIRRSLAGGAPVELKETP